MNKIEILEMISSRLLKIASFVTCLSSHFRPIWTDEKGGPGWMLHPSFFFFFFISYNLNKTGDIIMSAQFHFFSFSSSVSKQSVSFSH